MLKRRLNWKRELPDHRDLKFKALREKAPVVFPPSVDLRSVQSSVVDQLDIGSCTGNAWGGHLEARSIKATGGWVRKSRLFIYANERIIEHTPIAQK